MAKRKKNNKARVPTKSEETPPPARNDDEVSIEDGGEHSIDAGFQDKETLMEEAIPVWAGLASQANGVDIGQVLDVSDTEDWDAPLFHIEDNIPSEDEAAHPEDEAKDASSHQRHGRGSSTKDEPASKEQTTSSSKSKKVKAVDQPNTKKKRTRSIEIEDPIEDDGPVGKTVDTGPKASVSANSLLAYS